jgi:hypothetical protein
MNTICNAIKNRAVIAFEYKGSLRIVEPQCHGISSAGHEVLRAVQINDDSHSTTIVGKLFDVSKISNLRETGRNFLDPAPNHNPKDKAMKLVHCCLPLPGPKRKNRAKRK